MRRSLVRQLADAVVALVTWSATAFAVLWFYDWVSRWYVVVGVLLVIVAVAMVTDRVRGGGVGAASGQVLPGALPSQRDGEAADVRVGRVPSFGQAGEELASLAKTTVSAS